MNNSSHCDVRDCPKWEAGRCLQPNIYGEKNDYGRIPYKTLTPDNCTHKKFIEREREMSNE